MNGYMYVIYTREVNDMAGLHALFGKHFTKFSNDNYEWVHFVRDHYNRIRRKAVFITIDPYKMHEVHYRLTDFLMEYNIPSEADWIVLMLNQLSSEKDFINLKWMFLPDMQDIQDLREEFDTVDAHARSIIAQH